MIYTHRNSDYTGGLGNRLLLALQGAVIASNANSDYFNSNNINNFIWKSQISKFDSYINIKYDLSNTVYYLTENLLHKYIYNNTYCNNNIAIHFRGTDFSRWKKYSIMNVDFYINNIEKYYNTDDVIDLFTDDPGHQTYLHLLKYLGQRNIKFNNYSGLNYILAILTMSSSKIIIASPSTFSLCSALIGKKRIIYSLDYALLERDKSKFWNNIFVKKPVISIELT